MTITYYSMDGYFKAWPSTYSDLTLNVLLGGISQNQLKLKKWLDSTETIWKNVLKPSLQVWIQLIFYSP